MAIVRVNPTEIRVRCGWLDGRPRAVEFNHRRVPVLDVDHVRDEIAAYPVERGPRRVFDVRTPDARLRLAFEHRRRRWLLEGLEAA
jgi:hypothetical protein